MRLTCDIVILLFIFPPLISTLVFLFTPSGLPYISSSCTCIFHVPTLRLPLQRTLSHKPMKTTQDLQRT